MRSAGRLAGFLARPVMTGLALLLALGVQPAPAAASAMPEGHCAGTGPERHQAHAVQVLAQHSVATTSGDCGDCHGIPCPGPVHCVTGGLVAAEVSLGPSAAAAPHEGLDATPRPEAAPSFHPTPPTPPPNASSVR